MLASISGGLALTDQCLQEPNPLRNVGHAVHLPTDLECTLSVSGLVEDLSDRFTNSVWSGCRGLQGASDSQVTANGGISGLIGGVRHQ